MSPKGDQRTFRLTIEYDGSDFHGWQRQKNDRTVQEALESVLGIMTREKIVVIGSGRTDAGVHARGQVASFKTTSRLNAGTFCKGLNSLLPDDVVIRACDPMPLDFHARFDVRRKHYRYYILNRPLAPAIGRQFVWHIRKRLDIAAMQQAAAVFPGTHDFKAFEGSGSPRAHTVRTVTRAELTATGEGDLHFDIEANGFLRFMVRNIVGTLVEVGLGKIVPVQVERILASRDRSRAGATAPPQGLFLMKVIY
ncbi:tRNA pseudouridine synthase A [Desulfosarcina ovata subsp. sediminis]|uniref:tRNA pseudouridine synthase A n=1 Tax=Desulfosarcina ovata subsp. sediminis TaxID=885957 RepID=A0A5K7ZGY4_9BACT|nr:tRNA pseudouridine(38-40) synthase TruA [Desulfosarcina ovata]BBO80604.1 tRNA pseudouridine synthase A [Desulfosarcina ovata subsp. sediminis]